MFPQANHNKYVYGTFSIHKEHLQFSPIPEVQIIEEFLQGVEIDKELKPTTLVVYYKEKRNDYIDYFYSNDKVYIKAFQAVMYGAIIIVDPILN